MKVRLVMAALIAVSAGFQTSRPQIVGAADPFTADATYRDFFPEEDGLRWSGGRSAVVFPDPGPGVPARVELLVSGWRPPGLDAPNVVVTAGGRSIARRLASGAEVISIDALTTGVWRSDLVVEIRADTFEPGAGDARKLGIRIEEARLVPLSPGLRRPSLLALIETSVGALLIAFVLLRAGVGPRGAEGAALCGVMAVGALYAFARPYAAVGLGPAVLALGLAALVTMVSPRITRTMADLLLATGRALMAGLVRLRDIQLIPVLLMGAAFVTTAYRVKPLIDIDLGSGREVAVARGLGAFEGKGGVTSRRVPRNASLDLADFGGGGDWKVTVVAALDGPSRDVAVLQAGDRQVVTPLRETTWTEAATSVPAPFGWTSGLELTFPGGSDLLRIDRVTVERGSALPSLRVLLAVLAAALLVVVAFGAAGLSPLTGQVGGALVSIGSAVAVASYPLAAIPFVFPFLAIVAAATLLAAALHGAFSLFDPDGRLLPVPPAIGAAVSGWTAWLTATAFPYYRGGHFVFHSSIAEEIWKGRFLIYYLPFPGSMLSEQAQWGRIVMPHPALYQTLVSPLSALPRFWFYFSEKVLLATLFASMVLVASMVAQRVCGARAAAFTAVLFAGLVPGFQLLGLGHLMTILGVWSSTLALPWLMFHVDELVRFRVWLATAALFTFCFLSYTAALLFTGAVLVFVILVSIRTNRPRARSLFTMLVMASVCAFFLYYVHWTLPFLAQSVPKIMGGAGLGGAAAEATPILSRLALEPGKLSYSYGSILIPLAGVFGLFLLPRSFDRLVLLSWAGIVFFVSGVDLFFNFLLKHHYYVMAPVAIGLGTLMSRIESRFSRALPVWLTVAIVGLGLKTAIEVALGLIP